MKKFLLIVSVVCLCLDLGIPADGAAGDHGLQRQVVGKWKWFNGQTYVFRANGTVGGKPGNTWAVTNVPAREITVWWGTTYVDTLRLSPNGMNLEGQNQNGTRVWGVRIGSKPAPSVTPPPGEDSAANQALRQQVVGKWKWFNGRTYSLRANGTVGDNPGNTWAVTNVPAREITVRWGTAYVDTLRLSPNGMNLEGQNQNGTRVWGERVGAGPVHHHGGHPAMEHNTDRPGQDYTSFDLAAANPGLCRNACNAQPRCKAWTYVKPGVQGPQARCWLKQSAPPPVQSDCCISGVK